MHVAQGIERVGTLTATMFLTKRDIFLVRSISSGQSSSGKDGSSSFQALRGYWTNNGHHIALRIATMSLF